MHGYNFKHRILFKLVTWIILKYFNFSAYEICDNGEEKTYKWIFKK